MLAASSGSPVLTRVLLEAEANVNSQDKVCMYTWNVVKCTIIHV